MGSNPRAQLRTARRHQGAAIIMGAGASGDLGSSPRAVRNGADSERGGELASFGAEVCAGEDGRGVEDGAALRVVGGALEGLRDEGGQPGADGGRHKFRLRLCGGASRTPSGSRGQGGQPGAEPTQWRSAARLEAVGYAVGWISRGRWAVGCWLLFALVRPPIPQSLLRGKDGQPGRRRQEILGYGDSEIWGFGGSKSDATRLSVVGLGFGVSAPDFARDRGLMKVADGL